MLGGNSRALFLVVASVLSLLLLLGIDVCALSIQHRGLARCRSALTLASSTSSYLESGQQHQPRVSVTVDTTVSMLAMSNNRTTASTLLGTSSSTLSSKSSTPPTHSRDEPEDEDHAVISMDTPARQSLPSHLFRLHPIPGKGLGLICQKPILKGDIVGEYEGEVMSEDVKDRRYLPSQKHLQTEEDKQWIQSRLDRQQTLTGCYLYGISLPPNYNTDGNGQNTASRIYVDAEDEYESLWTRFINHASPPFNNVNPKSIHESYDGNPRVWFLANRDIAVGEEISFDYGDDYWLDGDDVL